MKKEINIDDLKNNMKFISNGARLQNMEEKLNCPLNVFVFTNNPTTKQSLLNKIFINIVSCFFIRLLLSNFF